MAYVITSRPSTGAHELKDDVKDLSAKNAARKVKIGFKDTDRTRQKLISAEHIYKAYDGRVLITNFTYLVFSKNSLGLSR